jgi:hypothetical protein|tara:strand:- start:299 stop:667 length:369 start_codon:yes stop_codon:yes gene_type:complete
MKKPTQHTRWHHVDPQTGQKVIRRFSVDATPPAPWVRGTGPHSAEALAKIKENNEKHFKGVPKSDNQKEKMSQAKLGRKFSAEHRKKLADGWKGKREYKRLRTIEAFKLAAEMGRELSEESK